MPRPSPHSPGLRPPHRSPGVRAAVGGLLPLAAVLWGGCLRDPDPGGQEGEERWPRLESDDAAGGGETSDSGGDPVSEPEVEGATGRRLHLRGHGDRGDYVCALEWAVLGAAVDDACPDCSLGFDLTFTLDVETSTREAGACDDVYGDSTGRVGLVDDYLGYGAMVVGIDPDTDTPYPLGPASLDSDSLGWSYGYRDEAWDDDGWHDTWYWTVSLDLAVADD